MHQYIKTRRHHDTVASGHQYITNIGPRLEKKIRRCARQKGSFAQPLCIKTGARARLSRHNKHWPSFGKKNRRCARQEGGFAKPLCIKKGRARDWPRRASRQHDTTASRQQYITNTLATIKNRRCARQGGKASQIN